MGWLPVFKRKSDSDSEPQTVQSAGGHGNPGGTGIMGDPSKSVVPQSGGATVFHSGGNTVNTRGGGYSGTIIGATYPTLDANCKTCGHEPSVAIVAGCWDYSHVHGWLACRDCQMETLRQIRHGESDTYVACGHKLGDLIYSYLPNDPDYHNMGDKSFNVWGMIAHG